MAGTPGDKAAAWLNTVGAATADTVQRDPRGTISPASRRLDDAKEHAQAVIQGLATGARRLRIERTIGQGGMGVVRLATQTALGRTVAIKALRADRRSEEATLDLMREAWITGSLEHPNVVPVHDIGLDDDGNPLIVLKRIEGVPWLRILGDADAVRERFGAEDLLAWNLNIFIHVVNAIRCAHSRGILHRDIKPEHIMIGEFGEVYVLDWGIAVSLIDDGLGRLPLAADATDIAGTPCYMAPEMLGDSDLPLSERTDIYLLGGLLYEIITGRPPHSGDSAIKLIESVIRSQPSFPDDAPSLLVDICRRAMAADPAERHASADELRVEIARFRKHRGSSRLAERAGKLLRELEALLAEVDAESEAKEPGREAGDAARRQSLYRLFGACRFGFREAIAAWADNRDAERGLQRAIELMARYELASGHPNAAAALLAELADAPAELREQVDAANAARAREGERMQELLRMKADLDLGVGMRTRQFVAAVLASVYLLTPLTVQLLQHIFGLTIAITHSRVVIAIGLSLALATGLFVWGRESMTKTAINRRIMAGLFIAVGSAFMLELGFWSMGLDVHQGLVFCILLWAVTSALLALTAEPLIWSIALGYLGSFAMAVWQPEWVLYYVALGNLIMLGVTTGIYTRYRARALRRQSPDAPTRQLTRQ